MMPASSRRACSERPGKVKNRGALEPNVNAKVQEALPTALQAALLNDELGHRILSEMAQRGELDEVLERVAMRMQGGGPEPDPDNAAQYADDESN